MGAVVDYVCWQTERKVFVRPMKIPTWRNIRLRPTGVELLGLTLIAVGLALAWLPLGIISGGIILVFIAQGLREPNEPA